MPLLTIGYSTLADRVQNIRFPKNADWEYQVHVQQALTKPVKPGVVYLDSSGVAKSRNSAIRHASGTYLLFGDDDVVFHEQALTEALRYLDHHPKVSLLLASAVDETGNLRKSYPTRLTKLNKFNCARAATYEMIVRVEDAKNYGVLFDEDFGAGAKNHLGDEYIFIADLISKGAECVFAPIPIAMHPANSSGARWGTKQDRIARARVFKRVFGLMAMPVRLAFALRRIPELGGFMNAAKFVISR
jgi:GT2 family glycosyltransferase